MTKGAPVKQWVYGENGEPKCTSFVRIGSVKRQQKKSEKTLKMFSDELGEFETILLNFKSKAK